MSKKQKIKKLRKRMSALELRVATLEGRSLEFSKGIAIDGSNKAALKRVEDDLAELSQELRSKLDTILRHLTGLSGHSN